MMPLVFIKGGKKIDSLEYIHILEKKVKPCIKANYTPDIKVVFQKDGAPARTAKKTQEWLKENIPDFWPKDLWPPNSPDLNLMEFPFGQTLNHRPAINLTPTSKP